MVTPFDPGLDYHVQLLNIGNGINLETLRKKWGQHNIAFMLMILNIGVHHYRAPTELHEIAPVN